MTKEKMEEKIICLLGYCSEDVINSINNIFEDFARTNVCIPRGENITIQKKVNVDEWVDAGTFLKNHEYRIKPSDPIYEWQFVFIQEGHQNILSEYMTDDELGNIHEMVTCIKIEETKKVRK